MVTSPTQSQVAGILLLWILCAMTYYTGIWGQNVKCNDADQQKLLSFKQQVVDSSGMLHTWSKRQDCCGWRGIECDNFTHRVTKLSLPCQGFHDLTDDCLTGQFNLSNLLELELLKYLNLRDNHLLFTYPHFYGNYSSKISYLDLSTNNPEAEVDDLIWLRHLYTLEYLDLSGIVLHSSLWLESISMLPSLLELYLDGCELHVINPSIKSVNFTSLQVLHLYHNNFQSDKLPTWLFNLSHILDLDLSQNHFQGHLLETILNLQKLKSLTIFGNKLDGPIPNWLGQHENLRYLDLSTNSFVGPIPETLGNLSLLIELYVGENHLNGSLPEKLGQLSHLEILHVKDTFLTGVITEKSFSQLSNLKKLFLGSPALAFHFDPHWIPPFQLHRLVLAYVYPKLPAWLYTQKSLQGLQISNSRLSFDDEDKFWNFVADVEYLNLVNYSINGNLSNVMLNSGVLQLVGNTFKGELPRISPKVTVFRAINNSFSGKLSSFLCQKMEGKSNLSFLRISNSDLSGELTECWMNWKSLVHISLPNNSLTGKIPESMSLLSNLKSLHLNKNNFFGYIPKSLQDCKKLSILNLGENKFFGNIPHWISKSVNVLLLRSNQFSGNIPVQLCQLSSLVVLDVANNRISGTIPNCLHNITAMVSRKSSYTYPGFYISVAGIPFLFGYNFVVLVKGYQVDYLSYKNEIMYILDLSHNNLIEKMPSEIFAFTKLQSLNLSNNQLVGIIPKEIGNLKQLESLDLSNNHIGGEIPQSMSELSFLGYLNLSLNNFSGQIPSTPEFQRFDSLCYFGNPNLCGSPLRKNCTPEEKPNITEPVDENKDEVDIFLTWFYIGMGVGFAVGFWGVCTSLLFNRKWRHSYFSFLDELKNQLLVFVLVKKNMFC